MVVIRLARTGAKKSPFYHLVATDKRNPRDGRYIERLGYYNPMARGQEKVLELQQDRIEYWLNQGAQPSDRAHNLIKKFKKGNVEAAAPAKTEARKAQAELAATAAKKKLEAELKAAEEKAAKEAESSSEQAESNDEPKSDD